MRTQLALVSLLVILSVSESPALCGDSDGTGQLTILDALAVAKAGAGLQTLVGPALWDGDVNSSGTLEILDALLIAQSSAGLPVTLACAPLSTGLIYVTAMKLVPGTGIVPMVSAYDRATGALVVERPLGAPATEIGHMALHPSRNVLYVTVGVATPQSAIVALDSRSLVDFARFPRPYLMGDLTVTPDGDHLVAVTIAGIAILAPISGALETTITLPAGGGRNSHIVAAALTDTAWVTSELAQTVHQIDLGQRTVSRTVATASAPWSVALSSDETRLFVVCKGSEELHRFDTTTGALLGISALGSAPIGVMEHAAGRVFVSNCGSQTMQEIDQTTGATLSLVPSPWKPTELAILSDGSLVTANMYGGVSVFDPSGVAPRLDVTTPAATDVQAR